MASIPCSPAGDGVAAVPERVVFDGVVPDSVCEPRTADELAHVLADAHDAGRVVAPVGGATSLALGNVPDRVDLAVSTRLLAGVLAYEPTDMTLSVQAGTRFTDVQALLAAEGQTLPVDVAQYESATIGGMIAAGVFGPRRTGSPSFRDLLIGISAAHPSGQVTKAGGMVVKNVSGFDLMRLYLGSLGTLGVIVSANFKVLPLARAESTLVARYDGVDEALSAASRIHGSRGRPTSLEVFAEEGAWRVALRIEGRETTVRLLAGESAQLLRSDAESLESSESANWWQRYTDAQTIGFAPVDALIRASVRPRLSAEAASSVWRCLGERGVETRLFSVTPALGQILCRVAYRDDASGVEGLAELGRALGTMVDHVAVLAAPPRWKRQIDVWGAAPATIDVMRALKLEFDPGRVLNRGRFAGRI